MLAPDFDRGKGRSDAKERNKGVSAEPARRRKIIHIDTDAFFVSVEQIVDRTGTPPTRIGPVLRAVARSAGLNLTLSRGFKFQLLDFDGLAQRQGRR